MKHDLRVNTFNYITVATDEEPFNFETAVSFQALVKEKNHHHYSLIDYQAKTKVIANRRTVGHRAPDHRK